MLDQVQRVAAGEVAARDLVLGAKMQVRVSVYMCVRSWGGGHRAAGEVAARDLMLGAKMQVGRRKEEGQASSPSSSFLPGYISLLFLPICLFEASPELYPPPGNRTKSTSAAAWQGCRSTPRRWPRS